MTTAHKQPSLMLEPTPAPRPPTKDDQLHVLRLAVKALLLHGARPDIVSQAEHALAISERPATQLRELDVPTFLRRKIGARS